MKILIHGFGTYAIFFYEVIRLSIKNKDGIQWSIILPTAHYKKNFEELIGKENVYYLHDEQMCSEKIDIAFLKNYCGNIYRDIESDKKTIKNKKAYEQEKNAFFTYLSYKKFLRLSGAENIIFPHIESHEGMILHSLAKELGLTTIVPTHTRCLGESFFSDEITEDLPIYASVDISLKNKAEEFLKEFNINNISAMSYPGSLENQKGNVDKIFKRNFFRRVLDYSIQLFSERSYQSWDGVRYRLLNNLPFIRDFIWNLRKNYNSNVYDCKSINDLPEKFIYYPLQYSPESSINTPAPYFIDQLRIIDALRLSMPSDMILVVKEHPSCIMVRNGDFIRSLKYKAGVRVAYYKMDNIEIIKKAALTVSVTGTANLEAFLLKKPSLVFGGCFFSEFLGGICTLDMSKLREVIADTIEKNINKDEQLNALMKILSVTYPFVIFTPNDGTKYGDMTMSVENIKNFYNALLSHITRRNMGRR